MPEQISTQNMANTDPGVSPTHDELYKFLARQPLGSIATNGPDGFPQNARVAFSVNRDFEFVIGTSETSRKATNMNRDGRVGFETTDTELRQTVQLKGTARRLSAEEFDEQYAEAHYGQLPTSRPFKDQPGQVHFAITPHWLRFSDCMPADWALTEYIMDTAPQTTGE